MIAPFDPALLDPKRLLLLLGLALFFGAAFEGFYHTAPRKPPGGIRTFPLLALLGAGLYAIEPSQALAFIAGLLILDVWLFVYYRKIVLRHLTAGEDEPGGGLVPPLCNLIAYLLGPSALLAPTWFSVGLVVAAVLLVGAREKLHGWAYRVPGREALILGQFLILSAIVLPLLPNEPVTSWTAITPYQVWLALVVISALSYGSYLAQRYLPFGGGITIASLLGGLYSSTATTVVLARRLHGAETAALPEIKSGMLLATALMYLRLGVIIAVFNFPLARLLAPALAVLLFLALALALLLRARHHVEASAAMIKSDQPANPLELSAAAVFALSFVAVSLASSSVKSAIGASGAALACSHRRRHRHRSLCPEPGARRAQRHDDPDPDRGRADCGILQQPAEGRLCARFCRGLARCHAGGGAGRACGRRLRHCGLVVVAHARYGFRVARAADGCLRRTGGRAGAEGGDRQRLAQLYPSPAARRPRSDHHRRAP